MRDKERGRRELSSDNSWGPAAAATQAAPQRAAQQAAPHAAGMHCKQHAGSQCTHLGGVAQDAVVCLVQADAQLILDQLTACGRGGAKVGGEVREGW